jgi:hypothetical protein
MNGSAMSGFSKGGCLSITKQQLKLISAAPSPRQTEEHKPMRDDLTSGCEFTLRRGSFTGHGSFSGSSSSWCRVDMQHKNFILLSVLQERRQPVADIPVSPVPEMTVNVPIHPQKEKYPCRT